MKRKIVKPPIDYPEEIRVSKERLVEYIKHGHPQAEKIRIQIKEMEKEYEKSK
jgi:predicted RNA-binding protein YlqC (UPF0109 family)